MKNNAKKDAQEVNKACKLEMKGSTIGTKQNLIRMSSQVQSNTLYTPSKILKYVSFPSDPEGF